LNTKRQHYWKLNEVVNPWAGVEEKFNIVNEILKFKVNINNFSDNDRQETQKHCEYTVCILF
jgi:hypothetical protein